MNKPIVGSLSAYEVNAVIPSDLISPLLELLSRKGGHLIRMTSHEDRTIPRPHNKVAAHEVILEALREEDDETHRADLRKALERSGHSPASVGPICTMLQKQGKVF